MVEWTGDYVTSLSPADKKKHWRKMLAFWNSVREYGSEYWKGKAGLQIAQCKRLLKHGNLWGKI